jgi:hypothetical protein
MSMKHRLSMVIALVLLAVASGCGANSAANPSADTLTPPPLPSEPPSATPSPEPLRAATHTPAPVAQVASPTRSIPPTITPTGSATPGQPTATPTATDTPGPYEYVIQAGDDCIGVLYKHGFNDLAAIDVLLQLNGLADCRQLPGPGTRILVPRPTPTATPEGYDITQTAVATSAPPMITLEVAGPSFSIQTYTVQQDDTLSSIAIAVDSTLRQLCELNAGPGGIDCRGCQWESAHCCCPVAPVLSVGQQINIPAPTPTPTFTPTFTGSETPTPTPTHEAPQMVYPAAGAEVSGPVRLSWVTVGPLAPDEMYLVSVRDETTGQTFSALTRQLSYDLPSSVLPADGAPREFAWQVSVVREAEDGLLHPTGAVQAEQSFTWQGGS